MLAAIFSSDASRAGDNTKTRVFKVSKALPRRWPRPGLLKSTMRGGMSNIPGVTGGGELNGATTPAPAPAYTVNKLGSRCSVVKRIRKTTSSTASLVLSILISFIKVLVVRTRAIS